MNVKFKVFFMKTYEGHMSIRKITASHISKDVFCVLAVFRVRSSEVTFRGKTGVQKKVSTFSAFLITRNSHGFD